MTYRIPPDRDTWISREAENMLSEIEKMDLSACLKNYWYGKSQTHEQTKIGCVISEALQEHCDKVASREWESRQ